MARVLAAKLRREKLEKSRFFEGKLKCEVVEEDNPIYCLETELGASLISGNSSVGKAWARERIITYLLWWLDVLRPYVHLGTGLVAGSLIRWSRQGKAASQSLPALLGVHRFVSCSYWLSNSLRTRRGAECHTPGWASGCSKFPFVHHSSAAGSPCQKESTAHNPAVTIIPPLTLQVPSTTPPPRESNTVEISNGNGYQTCSRYGGCLNCFVPVATSR